MRACLGPLFPVADVVTVFVAVVVAFDEVAVGGTAAAGRECDCGVRGDCDCESSCCCCRGGVCCKGGNGSGRLLLVFGTLVFRIGKIFNFFTFLANGSEADRT